MSGSSEIGGPYDQAAPASMPVVVPVLEEIDTKSRRRRWRRLGCLAVAGAVVAAGVAVSSAAEGGDTKDREVDMATRVTAPPRDWDAECDNDGDSRNAPAADLPRDLRFFPTYIPAGMAVTGAGASVWPDHLGCHHGSVALILAEMDDTGPDRVRRTVQVSGPSYRKRQPGGNNLMIDQPVAVRGDRGVWQTHQNDPSWGTLVWTDPEGGEWSLRGARSRAEAFEVAEGLRIDLDAFGPPVILKDPPGELEVLWVRPEPEGAGLEEEWSWGVTLEDPKKSSVGPSMPPPSLESGLVEEADVLAPPIEAPPTGWPVPPAGSPDAPPAYAPYSGPTIGISVTRMTTATTALTDAYAPARLTEVRGRRALEHAFPEGTASIAWDEEFGIQVTVHGSASLEELRKVAESLELVEADDPRLVGVEY